ncbi:MAG: 16S rRNA (guanine(966)-N(2))-methyltransferase RsmD [Actinomycetota bacterium]
MGYNRGMRIIGGESRGRRIKAPRGRGTRPMRDFVREAVFDMLGERVRGSRVLDLFAGSGSLGLEALSRGAAETVFVDRGGDPVRVIQENLDILGMRDRGRVVRAEIMDFLRRSSPAERTFDLIFIDPPFRIGVNYRQEVLNMLMEGGFLGPSSVVIMEAPLRSPVPEPPPGLNFRERRKYGETAVDVYVFMEKDVIE